MLFTKDKLQTAEMSLLILGIAMAPFDEILVMHWSGMNVRYALLAIALALLLLPVLILQKRKIYLPLGWQCLAILLGWNATLCFMCQTTSFIKLAGYEVWFILDVGIVLAAVNVFRQKCEKLFLVRAYLLLQLAMSIVCIMQVILGLIGINWFAEQRFGVLVRGDAFLSEPSYYACFAVPGWVSLSWQIEQRQTQWFSQRAIHTIWLFLSAALVFSTSRMGLLMMLLWLFFRFLVCWRQKRSIKPLLYMVLALGMFMLLLETVSWGSTVLNLATQSDGYSERMRNLAGSDLPRLEGMKMAFETFWRKHILLGSSLGGVEGSIRELFPSRDFLVSNLIAELLVALGIPGVLVLTVYMTQLCRAGAKEKAQEDLLWALVWQLALLQFNNNGLRVYVWVNIAMLSVFFPQTEIQISLAKKERI
jgi:hypothetical protein